MKTSFKFLAVALLALGLFLTLPARAQLTPTTGQTLLSNIVLMTEVGVTNLANAKPYVEIVSGKPISFVATLTGTNALTVTNVAFKYQLSADATKWANNAGSYVWQVFAPLGTTAVYAYTNIPIAATEHMRYLRLVSFTNNNAVVAAGVYVTNVTVYQNN